jgi:hypothetical protein
MGLGWYLVDAVVLERRRPSELAKQHGVSRSWIYELVQRYGASRTKRKFRITYVRSPEWLERQRQLAAERDKPKIPQRHDPEPISLVAATGATSLSRGRVAGDQPAPKADIGARARGYVPRSAIFDVDEQRGVFTYVRLGDSVEGGFRRSL